MRRSILLKIVKCLIFCLFSAACLGSGLYASGFAYRWGSGDGSGALVWIFCVSWLFALLMIALLVIALLIFTKTIEFPRIKPHVAIFLGTAGLFFLNWFIPYCNNWGGKPYSVRTSTWEWILYASLPFIYGGVSYLMFKIIRSIDKSTL